MFQPFHINRWTRGATLVGEPDAIPDDALRIAQNVRLDRTLGSIEVRPGWTVRSAIALASAGVYLSRLFVQGLAYGYAQVGTLLQRLDNSWNFLATIATPGAQPVSDANSPDGFATLYKYCVNNTIAVKDNGTTTTTMGIARPGTSFSAVALATDLSTTINAMDDHTQWTGTSVTGKADDTTNFQENSKSVFFIIAASTFGSIAQFAGAEINLDTMTGGDNTVKDDDYIHLWVRVDRPDYLTFMQIDIDVDVNSAALADCFRHNYYSVRLPAVSLLSQGINSWTEVQVRKSAFARYGTQGSRSWVNARGFRIGFLTNSQGAVSINVDDFKLRGGVGIEGDVEYTLCYRNSSTGARGNPPKDADGIVVYTSSIRTNRQRISITTTNVRQGGAAHPGDTQIDKMMIWRRGGSFDTAVLVDTINDTDASPYVDNTSDVALVLTNISLETDNDMPPVGQIASAPRVLFGPDGTGSFYMIVDGFRLYKSKPYEDKENRVENWPAQGFAYVGDGSARALAGIANTTQVRAWTSALSYNVVGVGQDVFLPIPLDGTRGIVGQFALCAGESTLFFVSQDGIYMDVAGQQQKLTAAIDPWFQGLTVDGFPGLGVPPPTTRLAYLHQPKGGLLLMTYPGGFLVVKPNLQNGQLSECFFGSSALTELGALYADTLNRELLGIGTNGVVYLLEDETTYNDNGTVIDFTVRTKSFDLGQPQHGKFVAQVECEGQTSGQSLILMNHYDRGTDIETFGTVATASEVGLVLLPASLPEVRRRDIAFTLTGQTTNRIAITRLGVLFEPQPELQTYLDSGIQSFDFIQQLKRLEVDWNLPVDTTLTIYAEGVAVYSRPALRTNGRQNEPYYLPAGLRGRAWRFTLVSSTSTPFLVYKMSGFFKTLGADQHYQERIVVQGV